MKIKYLILLSIIICLSIFKISCSEKNQEIKLTKEEQAILNLFNPMSSEWLNLVIYYPSQADTKRLEKIKQYALQGGDLSFLGKEVIENQDTNVLNFILQHHNNLKSELLKNIPLPTELTKIITDYYITNYEKFLKNQKFNK